MNSIYQTSTGVPLFSIPCDLSTQSDDVPFACLSNCFFKSKSAQLGSLCLPEAPSKRSQTISTKDNGHYELQRVYSSYSKIWEKQEASCDTESDGNWKSDESNLSNSHFSSKSVYPQQISLNTCLNQPDSNTNLLALQTSVSESLIASMTASMMQKKDRINFLVSQIMQSFKTYSTSSLPNVAQREEGHYLCSPTTFVNHRTQYTEVKLPANSPLLQEDRDYYNFSTATNKYQTRQHLVQSIRQPLFPIANNDNLGNIIQTEVSNLPKGSLGGFQTNLNTLQLSIQDTPAFPMQTSSS